MIYSTLATSDLANRKAALVVGHPGHELRLHGWLEIATPHVFMLTDGSGGAAQSRLNYSERVLREANCEPGGIFGVFTDKQIYELIINSRFDTFISLVTTLADRLRELDVDYVVGDACEGYNPSHDLCRIVLGAAVQRLRRQGMPLLNFGFPLHARPDECDLPTDYGSVRLDLTNDQFERKMAAAWGYTPLVPEVEESQRLIGLDAFRVEWLRPTSTKAGFDNLAAWRPYYETYGEQQVASGRYARVLRYREHFRPLANALWEYATSQSGTLASTRFWSLPKSAVA